MCSVPLLGVAHAILTLDDLDVSQFYLTTPTQLIFLEVYKLLLHTTRS